MWCVCNSDVRVGDLRTLRRVEYHGRSSEASFSSLKNADESRRTAVQAIERRFEHIAGSIPRVRDTSTRVELRIEIAGYYDRGAIPWEQHSDLPRLPGIHHDNEVRASDCRLCERAGAVPRQVEATFRTQGNGYLRNGPIAAEESGRLYRKIRKFPLKYRLQIRASTDVAVAHHEYFPGTPHARQPLPYFAMAAAM